MKLPRPHTVRAKLTLTTTLVMAFVLVALGFLVDYGTVRTVMRTVDKDLEYRGHDFARGEANRPDRPRGPRGMGGPGGLSGIAGPGSVLDMDPGDALRRGAFGGGDRGGPFGGRRTDQDDSRPHIIPAEWAANTAFGQRDVPLDIEAFRAALATKRPDVRTIMRSGAPYRVYSEAVVKDGKATGVVQVGYTLTDVNGALDGLQRLLVTVAIPLGVLLAGGASLVIVGRLLRPVRLLNENAERIEGDNFEGRLPIVGEDEFAGLATTLNGMLARLEEAFRLEQATSRRLEETVQQQRRFTADASHELKTPLSTIKAHLGLLKMSDLAEEDLESVEASDLAANRMRGLVDDLLVLARADGGSLTARSAPVDLGDAIDAAVGAVAPTPVEVRGAPRKLVVNGNGEALTRLFINLLDNARKYAGTSEPVEVRVAKRGDSAEIAVVDHGVGIAPEHLPKLFDRFYRPDVSRTSETGGTGLGLAICKEIAAAHGGTIEVASRVGQGTAFTVVLPLAT